MKMRKFMVVMGLVSLNLLGTAGIGYANEIDKLTDGNQTVQDSGGSSNRSSSDVTSKSNNSGSDTGERSNKGYGTKEPPKSNVNGHLYDNEGDDSSGIDDTIDTIRKELPKARNNEVLGQVQSTINKGRIDAGNTARWITKPIAKWVMVIVSTIVNLLGVMFLLSTAISLLYAIAPPLRFMFDDDDVAQRNLQMTQASQGVQGSGTAPTGVFSFIRSLFKVDDDMIQAMIEGNLMQGASGGGQAGGYNNPMGGAAFGGGYNMGGQAPRQVLHSAPRANKHVLSTYMRKRALTVFFLVLFITIFFSSLVFDYAGNVVEFVVRLLDLLMNQLKEF